MKNVFERILNKYGLFITAAAVFVATFLINNVVPLYGDDFAYKRFISNGLNYYINRHIEHYFLANGRVIVHLLVTLFLYLPHFFWAIFNALMLACIVFFGAKLASGQKWEKCTSSFWSGIVLVIAITFLSPVMTRQSVYWLTGSFNYVYPLAVFIIYWFFINRPVYVNKIKWIIPVLALLAAASVEQISLMTVGLTILILMERVFRKQKPDSVLIIALITALIGMATILLSPSVAYRASMENAPAVGFLELIRYNVKNQGTTFLFSGMMMPYHLFAMLSALGSIFMYRSKVPSKTWRIVGDIAMAIGAASVFCWVWQVTKNSAEVNYTIFELKDIIFYSFIGCGYVLILIYASILSYKVQGNKSFVLISAVILCFGSQLMMVVSPVYGPRNLLSAVFMLALFSASLLPNVSRGLTILTSCIACFLFDFPLLAFLPVIFFVVDKYGSYGLQRTSLPPSVSIQKKSIAVVIAYATLILISGRNYAMTLKGYTENAKVYEYNLQATEDFKNNASNQELTQYKLPNDLYGWAMPYHNPYYDPYYKLYIGVDAKTKIVWKNPG